MSGACEAASGRGRPLSSGLWTLFSWLRRDEHSSSESVSSAGSDRTALSFAFLPVARCSAPPARLPPPSPTSASYRRRVRERSLRRQRERDLTLHRKYGLYGLGFDTASLPSTRDRRAVSESPRAHVPGKRRAPPPPVPQPATLPRRRARKRPAPPPPAYVPPMSRLPLLKERPRSRDDATDCKPEKYSKRDAQSKETKEVKLRSEKSFLKQIFENKKRNSAVDTSTVKLLPNISELDKQAAEMIEKYRLKEMPPSDVADQEAGKVERSNSSRRQPEAWICTRCLKKYDSSVITCNYCLPINKHTDPHRSSKVSDGTQTKGDLHSVLPGSTVGNIEDKERLKEMLKEMKDSLPKRPKSELITINRTKNSLAIEAKEDYPKLVEAATLRIGSSISVDKKSDALPSTSNAVPKQSTAPTSPTQKNKSITNDSMLETINSVVITQPVVLVHTKENVVSNVGKVNMEKRDFLPIKQAPNKYLASSVSENINEPEKPNPTNDLKSNNGIFRPKYDLNTPLKISSLLNPIYIPKTTSTANTQTTQVVKQEAKHTTTNNKEKPATCEPQTNTEEIIRKLIVPQSQTKSTVSQTSKDEKPATESKQKVETKISPSNEKTQAVLSNKNIEVKNNVNVVKASSREKSEEVSSNGLSRETTEKVSRNVSSRETNEEVSRNVSSRETNEEVSRNVSSREKTEKVSRNVSSRETNEEVSRNVSSRETTEEVLRNLSSRETTKDVSRNVSSSEKFVEILNETRPSTSKGDRVDQHARRRDLINQLERSIARGDEQAAAEAAVKLAQLKLSCSVLSFSSQIVAETDRSISAPHTTTVLMSKDDLKKTEAKILDDSTQKSSQVVKPKSETVSTKQKENDVNLNKDKLSNKQPKSTKLETQQSKQSGKPNGLILPKVDSGNQTPSANTSTAKGTVTKHHAPRVATASNTEITKKEENADDDEEVPILIWVEDKEATRGPVQLHIARGAALGTLRTRAERSLGVPARLQRWVIGRALCSDDTAPLVRLAGPGLDAPFYLCLVEPDNKPGELPLAEEVTADAGNVYTELVNLEKQALVPNAEAFDCGVCTEECPPGGGVVLRECVHMFCRACLASCAQYSDAAVACPAPACRAALQDREVRALLPAAAYDAWLARGLAAAESGSRGAFHCRTRDCAGWAMCEPGVARFPCPVCRRTNCLPCQAIHEGETCEQYRARQSVGASETDEGTRALLDSLIARGEALPCPECSAIITKKWGCDWIKCSACKTEICWVTRGRRWGPAGRGDTSAGCRCGVDGKRCHPSCGYCH